MKENESKQYKPDLTSEYVTGDQSFGYRKRRGAWRYPSWREVEVWRKRWTPEKVEAVLKELGEPYSAYGISSHTGFDNFSVRDDHGKIKVVPDLRGLDLALLPPDKRRLNFGPYHDFKNPLDLSYARLEGARLIDLDLSNANLFRAQLQKTTLRRTKFKGSILTKAHLEDADLRDAVLDEAHLGHIRYTVDGFWWRGTVLMETHLNRALYVDPLLERNAKDQYYLYVLKYRNRNNPFFKALFFIWWITSNYGKSFLLWALWSTLLILGFACKYYLLGAKAFAMTNLDWNIGTMIYYSVVTFTTLGFGDITPKSQEAAWWVMTEVILGYIMLGGLISILANKIARRS